MAWHIISYKSWFFFQLSVYFCWAIEELNSIIWLKPATIVCLSRTRTLISFNPVIVISVSSSLIDRRFELLWGPSWPWSYGSWIYNYLCNRCLSPLMWVQILYRVRCTTLCDKVCQWLAACQWFSPASSTNKTDRYDITEILLKVALNPIKQNQTYCCVGDIIVFFISKK
jgi:hypothetical protein